MALLLTLVVSCIGRLVLRLHLVINLVGYLANLDTGDISLARPLNCPLLCRLVELLALQVF